MVTTNHPLKVFKCTVVLRNTACHCTVLCSIQVIYNMCTAFDHDYRSEYFVVLFLEQKRGHLVANICRHIFLVDVKDSKCLRSIATS